MEEIIALVTKTYGIAGLIMLSPFVGLVVVWKHNLKLQKDLAEQHKVHVSALGTAHDALLKLQENRVSDIKAHSDKLLTLVVENSTATGSVAQALDQVRELLLKLTTTLTAK